MKKLLVVLVILVISSVCYAWVGEEYLLYIDIAEGTKLTIGPDTFLHSVRVKKVGTKQLWLVLVKAEDYKFKQKALTYIANHPELDIQYWRSYEKMYQDTVGIGRVALSYILNITYDFDGDPETDEETKTVKEALDLGYTWQQVINNKDKITYPIWMYNMEVE